MSTEEIKDKILAALKKLGPSSPRVIADQAGIDPGKVGYSLGLLLEAKAVKAAGTSNDRRYALPEQKFERAASGSRRKRKSPATRKTPAPRATPLPLFLPAFTEDYRLVIVQDGGHTIFTPEQTQAIADLLLTHFEAS